MADLPKDIVETSQLAANLPASRRCTLPGGREVSVRRLSWLEFEQVWQSASRILAVLLLAEDEITEERLAQELTAAPKVVAALVALATGAELDALGKWQYDDVLAAAGAAAKLNFVDSRGIRDFFVVARQLAGQPDAPVTTGP
jgi:hypothetical protein